VFGFGYAEIGAALGRPEVTVRQIGHRAREHVHARRPRFEVDRGQQREVTQRFLDAAAGGDIDRLISVLAPDVTVLSDGGGQARAARRPVTGAAKAGRLLAGLAGKLQTGRALSGATPELTEINGGPGLVFAHEGQVLGAVTWTVSGGLVTAVQIITNPHKLAALSAGRTLAL
jgi:RNA polymerase sigma-70 factor (ECF subfamily)